MRSGVIFQYNLQRMIDSITTDLNILNVQENIILTKS